MTADGAGNFFKKNKNCPVSAPDSYRDLDIGESQLEMGQIIFKKDKN